MISYQDEILKLIYAAQRNVKPQGTLLDILVAVENEVRRIIEELEIDLDEDDEENPENDLAETQEFSDIVIVEP